MTDFSKILDKAKELETKMKESQENIKKIRVEGISGSNSVKIILDGEGEVQKIEISDEILKEDKSIIEDLIVAAFSNAKSLKTSLAYTSWPSQRKGVKSKGKWASKSDSKCCSSACPQKSSIGSGILWTDSA